MALSVSFSASQTAGSPSVIDFTDNSSGTDVAVVSRKIYIRDYAGNSLVEDGVTTDYSVWGNFPATTAISLDVFPTKDMAVFITVEWCNVAGAALYTASANYGFTLYNSTFDYLQTQLMAGNTLLINDNNFFPNKEKLRTLIDSGNNAVSFANDLYNAQLCYDQATAIRLSSQYLFNGNS